jgi:quercetin dioxygenase-like cupin family protein
VPISDTLSINYIVVKPGNSTNWSADDDKKRVITVFDGKVRVTLDDETFEEGPKGVVIVNPGSSCKAWNRLYIDATLQCQTFTEY